MEIPIGAKVKDLLAHLELSASDSGIVAVNNLVVKENETLNPIAHIDPIGTVLFPVMQLLVSGSVYIAWAKPVPINLIKDLRFIIATLL